MKRSPAVTVSAYFASASPAYWPILKDLRKAIISAAPKAEETISYMIPTYKLKGALVHFAAQKISAASMS